MRNRLRRELHDFFLQDNISLETNLFNQLIYDMAKIKLPESKGDRYYPGFELRSYNDSEELDFTLPNLAWNELRKILAYFKVSEEAYVANSPVRLSEDYVFNTLLPEFKKYYESLKTSNPSLIAKHKVDSKPILESSAVSTLADYTGKVKKSLLSDDEKVKKVILPEKTTKAIVDAMRLLRSTVDDVRSYPISYKAVIELADPIKSFLQIPEVKASPELTKQLNLLVEAIALYKRFNRVESVLAGKAFFKEVEDALNRYQMTSKKCDIIERIVGELAGVEIDSSIKCKLKSGNDASRLVFTFTNSKDEKLQPMVNYLRNAGDETATLGFGFDHHGSAIPESAAAASIMYLHAAPGPREVICGIETDAKFFYQVIFPRLLARIDYLDKNDPVCLSYERKLSQEYLAEKNKDTKKFSGTLFGGNPAVPGCPEPLSDSYDELSAPGY